MASVSISPLSVAVTPLSGNHQYEGVGIQHLRDSIKLPVIDTKLGGAVFATNTMGLAKGLFDGCTTPWCSILSTISCTFFLRAKEIL